MFLRWIQSADRFSDRFCGSETASTSSACHRLGRPFFCFLFLTSPNDAPLNTRPSDEQQGSRKQTVSHKSQVHAPGEKTRGRFFMSNSPLLPLLSSLSLLPRLSITRSCGSFITGLLSGTEFLSLAFLLPSSVDWLQLDSYLRQPCELLDPVDPSPSPGGGHQPDRGHLSACNGGLRLWSEVRPLTARWRGTAATDAKKNSQASVYVCQNRRGSVTPCQRWINTADMHTD